MADNAIPLPGVSTVTTITDWEHLFGPVLGSGVIPDAAGALAGSLDTSGRNAVVNPGAALIRGFWKPVSSATPTPVPAAAASNRIDRLVLRLNRAATDPALFIVPVVITGTPAANPLEPALVRTTTGLWDLPICSWTSASTGALTALADERIFLSSFRSGVSTQRPALTGPGLFYETDTGKVALYTGTAWQYVISAPDVWHTMTLTSGWSAGQNNGATDRPSYKLLPDGSVALRGTLLTPAAGNVTGVSFASVPAQYQPPPGGRIPQATISNATGNVSGTVWIRPNGNLQLQGPFSNAFNVVLDSRILIS